MPRTATHKRAERRGGQVAEELDERLLQTGDKSRYAPPSTPRGTPINEEMKKPQKIVRMLWPKLW